MCNSARRCILKCIFMHYHQKSSYFHAARATFCRSCCSIRSILRMVWGILFVCSCDAILDDVLTSSQRSSSCRVSIIFWIVVAMHGLVANEISCPWLLFVWVVSYHWWWRPSLRCQSVVACDLILQGWFWCIPLCAPWFRVLQVLLRWLMTWCSWWCVQCLILCHCLVVWWCHLIGKNVPRLWCMLWVHSSSSRCCVLLIPYRWRDKIVLHPPVWLDNRGVNSLTAIRFWREQKTPAP